MLKNCLEIAKIAKIRGRKNTITLVPVRVERWNFACSNIFENKGQVVIGTFWLKQYVGHFI